MTHESSPTCAGSRAQPALKVRRRPARSPGPYPDKLRRIADAGHDIVAHGIAQNMVFPALSQEHALRSIVESTDAIGNAIGHTPKGWISRRVTSGLDVQRMLAAAGYHWHGDVIDADLPYVQRFGDEKILAIPMSVEFNDLPHALRFGRTPGQFIQMFSEALDGIKRSKETIILDIFAHGHCYGRPAGAWAIEEIAKICKSDPALWLTTRSEIAECRMEWEVLQSSALEGFTP